MDMECSNCFERIGKICEFGYVKTDESLNVIFSDDIPMAPGKRNDRNVRFDTTIYKRDPEFQWAYEPSFYFEQPEFPYFYDKIKHLINSSTMIFGYAVMNDVGYLANAFNRYKLTHIDYKVCDLQHIINQLFGGSSGKSIGLKAAFLQFYDKSEMVHLNPHLSRDDAYMTMMVLKGILDKLNVTVDELIEMYPDSMIDSKEYDKVLERRAARKAWRSMCDEYRDDVLEGKYDGKLCMISSLINGETHLIYKAIDYVKEHELIPCTKKDFANYIICVSEGEMEQIKTSFEPPFEGEFIIINK
jgi:hypothetical protein